MTALRTLLAGSIDYAGLFPPAALNMSAAVGNYAEYLESDARWALGRFVVPAARLDEFEAAVGTQPYPRPAGRAWRLSVLLGSDFGADARIIDRLNCRQATDGDFVVLADAIEAKASSPEAVAALLGAIPNHLERYVEVPVDRDPAPLVSAIAARGGSAKIRTGGVTAEAFPAARDIVRFIGACAAWGVQFKATAGLHHPLRGDYPLTYAAGSPRGTMFGFLNVFLAASFMASGMDSASAELLLEETLPASLEVTPGAIEWRGHRLGADAIEAARGRTIVSFGSCSFTEPIGDLAALGLL